MCQQNVITASENYEEILEYLKENNIKKLFVVCDGALQFLRINNFLKELEDYNIKVIYFNEFSPNPLYDSVVCGVDLFRKTNCELILAIGGGSTIDVAKCIKLYSNMDSAINYLEQAIIPNDVKLIAVPTTAGSGSEATKYAVIYYNGEKQSVTHESCIPSLVIMDATILITLPEYQKKSTMLDALCHAIESYWSINSTDESKIFSKEAIRLICSNRRMYLLNDENASVNMLKAANLAGKAINITQTTAGHAMCYKLTSLYGIAHGHAAALCLSKLWPYMINNLDKCIEPRGIRYLEDVFCGLANAFDCHNSIDAIEIFDKIIEEFDMEVPKVKEEDITKLVEAVNPVRLKNNPIMLDSSVIMKLYEQILGR